MQDLQLYTLIAAHASTTELGSQQQQQVASLGLLGEDGGDVEQVASEPGGQTISGFYRGRYAQKMANELAELATASGITAVPIAGVDSATPLDGYYEVENADVGPQRAASEHAQSYELDLRKQGTRSSHRRQLVVNPRQADHEFGVALEGLVGVPASATKVQWWGGAESGARAVAEPVETVEAELGSVDRYDLQDGADALGLTLEWSEDDDQAPSLIYDIGYLEEENVDVRVWDTLGEGTKHDDDGALDWQKVFSTEHDLDDAVVLSNGCLRIILNEDADTAAAGIIPFEWAPDQTTSVEGTGTYGSDLYGEGMYAGTTGDWTLVGLTNDSDWELYDVDLTNIGMVDVRAQLEFLHPDDGLFDLNVSLQRGRESLLVGWPENETGPIPTGLADWLAPIAATSIADPQPSKGLVSRSEVRR